MKKEREYCVQNISHTDVSLCLAHLVGSCSVFMYNPMFTYGTGTDLEVSSLSVLGNDDSHVFSGRRVDLFLKSSRDADSKTSQAMHSWASVALC